MAELSSNERAVVERAGAEPMLDQVLAWAAINSGSRNLAGLERMADLLADAFAALPGRAAARAIRRRSRRSMRRARRVQLEHGRHLHLTVRPTAPVQLLLTGHMDTVFGADHAFQETRWLEDGVLERPRRRRHEGRARGDARGAEGGRAERLRRPPRLRSRDQQRRGSRLAVLRRRCWRQAAQGKRAALTYEPAALPDGTLAGARPGSGNFAFVVRGRSAHAGRNPEDGRNALLPPPTSRCGWRCPEARRPEREPVADRGRRPEQRRPRPCGAAGQHAAARRPRSRLRAKRAIDEAVAAVAAERDVRIDAARRLRTAAQAADPRG